MKTLGESFPEDERRQFAERHLVPGNVLYIDCEFTEPPKPKCLVVACVEPELLFFVVNSRIPRLMQLPELISTQVKMESREYAFLSHDSFINCAEVITAIDKTVALQQLADEPWRFKGSLSARTVSQVCKAVLSAKTVSQVHKEEILRALEQCPASCE